MEIKKILVPVDGSDASKRAFKMAIDVAKVYGAKLVVTCIADVSEAAYPIMGVTLDKNGFINIKAKAERLLVALKEEIPSELDYEEIVETGIPGARYYGDRRAAGHRYGRHRQQRQGRRLLLRHGECQSVCHPPRQMPGTCREINQ